MTNPLYNPSDACCQALSNTSCSPDYLMHTCTKGFGVDSIWLGLMILLVATLIIIYLWERRK